MCMFSAYFDTVPRNINRKGWAAAGEIDTANAEMVTLSHERQSRSS